MFVYDEFIGHLRLWATAVAVKFLLVMVGVYDHGGRDCVLQFFPLRMRGAVPRFSVPKYGWGCYFNNRDVLDYLFVELLNLRRFLVRLVTTELISH